jgi:Domain of unknown function (DUF3448).
MSASRHREDASPSGRPHEERRFAPPVELAEAANVTADVYAEARQDRPAFWAEQARRLTWATEPTETLDWSNPPFAKWFADGKLNVAYPSMKQPKGHSRRSAAVGYASRQVTAPTGSLINMWPRDNHPHERQIERHGGPARQDRAAPGVRRARSGARLAEGDAR